MQMISKRVRDEKAYKNESTKVRYNRAKRNYYMKKRCVNAKNATA
jgi:hypothetical protein